MKVVALTAIGHLELQERAIPIPAEGEVLLKIMASGVCGSDIPRAYQTGTLGFPRVLGHEFAGRVEAVGPGGNPELIGKRMAVFPIVPCKTCEFCQQHHYPRCLNYSSYGSRRDGGFSEYLTVPEFNLVEFPDHVSYTAAAMLEPATIALHVIRRAKPDLNDNIAIFGAGPIGLMAARWAKLQGAQKVMLIDIDAKKIEFCRQLGFEHVCLATEQDAVEWVLQNTGGFGAHITIEGSGSRTGLAQALLTCRVYGKVMLMGNPHDDMQIPRDVYDKAMRKELIIASVYNSVYKQMPHDEWVDAANAISRGKLQVNDLISHQVEIDNVVDLFNTFHHRSEFTCKGMMITRE
ncbi:galactitol-1-phosphate 5-dehydrogenase [Citrobacter sp. NCU1]|uniref:galactitol-1-phosphate 5-dehydrogenase n=1 Tax=Citrobacter sp. NCU1 TaxID=2026683 RepID=UPI001391EE9A|nr:galactitol-1-phosphate 5-dehydrogenase [Citrobacter sp. NCU1]NDO83772.1 galactitol-1-phosphate 5-dehydrogenase [Citrobacter sp. NCU1]